MHPFADLSAYLDDALSPEARATVDAHLGTCALCRTRLAELRGTARLIAALPAAVPSRSLVPRVSAPFWLAPLRTFSTFASGVAIFLFVASAVIAFFPRTQFATTAGAPAPNAVSAPQASGAAGGAEAPSRNLQAPSPVPAAASARFDATAPASDSSKEVGPQDASSSFAIVATDQSTHEASPAPAPFAFLLSPWLWLVVAIAFGALSLAVGRRLRST